MPRTSSRQPSPIAAAISSPVPRLPAVSGAGTPPGSRVSPEASASSTTAVSPCRAYAADTGSPVGPLTVTGTGSNPAATAAARVPSPPSATGQRNDVQVGARPQHARR